MKLKIDASKINWFFPIFLAFGAWICATGKVSWWVLLLMVISKVDVNFKINGR